MKNLTLFSIVALLTFLPIFTVNASVEIVLLDEVVKRGWGKPNYETFAFSGSGGKATLKVFNGKKHKKRKNVVAAKILLNDEKVVGPRQLNWKVNYQEIEVDLLEGENTLSVLARGFPKSKLKVQVIQVLESEVSAEIGIEGGIVEVDNLESPISGTALEIPPESIPETVDTVEIEITAVPIPAPLPETDIQAGNTVNIESNVDVFNEPVLLTIPYNDENDDGVLDGTTISEIRVGVKYFNGANWEEVEVTARDAVNNVVTVATTHFSEYVAYADGEIPAYDETQVVSDGAIIIDGNRSDWDSLTPGPVDPEFDNTQGDSAWDIKHVYTAIDSQYAYLMIETYGGVIPADATIEVYLNHKSGEDFPWLPYADMGMASNPDGWTNFWNYPDGLDIQGVEAIRGNVLEIKVPLSEIENATYFNVIMAKVWKENYADVYDQFSFGPYMDYWIHSRSYYNGTNHCRITIELIDENGNYVHDDINPQSITLINLDDMSEQAIEADAIWEPWFLLLGRWIDYPTPDWYYDETFMEGGDYYVDFDSIVSGNYRLRIIDQQGNKYERDYYYGGPMILPEVYPAIDEDNLFFDSDGNLHAYWNSPFWDDVNESIRIYPFQDNEDPNLTAIWAGTHLDQGYVKVPAATLQKLYDRGGPFSLGVQVRSGDRSNRWYAEKVSLDAIPIGTPPKWQQPIVEDWTIPGGFEPIRWFPYYFREHVNATPDIDSVTIETTEDKGGQALYISKYEIEGNFDIQIDFQLNTWPQAAGKWDVGLTFQFGYGYNALSGAVIGITPSGGFLQDGTPTTAPRVYFSDGGPIDIPTHDTSGKFRIERVGATTSVYFWDMQNSAWVSLNTMNDIGPQPIVMSVHNWGWGGNPGGLVSGTFSNFKRTN